MNIERVLALPKAEIRPDTTHGSLFFIGTATVLLQYAGFTILTDPNFLHRGEQVHLGYGLRATRRTNPAMELEDLIPLDLIILSHMHEDHFDRVVERKLDKGLRIVTTPQAAAALKKKGFRWTYALKTWETLTVTRENIVLRITSMPGKHAPGPLSALLPPVMGSMLEFQVPAEKTILRLYITGDTLIHEHLKEIPKRYPEIDLALLHLGGTKIFGVLLTMDGKQGVEAIKMVDPRTAIPIHFNDYNVFKSPLEDFMQAVAAAGLEDRVHYLNSGETYMFNVPQ
jgi:L-ascorbate metabolism protein UlaG (beta-lactamase superfamily)